MRRYVSACVATLESVTLLLFVFTNTSSGFVRHFSVAGARNALHGWCAWCRGPLSSRTSSTFSSRCASIREPTHLRTHRTHLFARGDLFSHRCDTGTLTRLVLHLPLPPFPSVIQSTKNFLAPLRSAVESIVPADSAHYWILLVTLLVCPALILYGHHVETRYVSFYLFTYGQL